MVLPLSGSDRAGKLSAEVQTPGRRAWRRFRRHKMAVVSGVVLGILITMVILAPLTAPIHPFEIDFEAGRYRPPSGDHWLGTDAIGRDVWSRLIYGGRVSLAVGLAAITIRLLIGTVLGATAGYYGGIVDSIIMRLTDVFLALPNLLLILALVVLLGPGIMNGILVIGLLGWGGIARLVRGQILSLREKDYVLAARSVGSPDRRIMMRHLLPNLVGPLTVAATFGVAAAILTEAALSFLGLGVQVPTPSWGNMLTSAQQVVILRSKPWLWLPPGTMIAICVLCLNIMGDGLRDALDPHAALD